MVRPSALAVLRVDHQLKVVDWITGRSDCFVPLVLTNHADRRLGHDLEVRRVPAGRPGNHQNPQPH